MKHYQGFTAVELMITIVVGTLLILSMYQLYSFVVNDSAAARKQAAASNLAYQLLRERSGAVTDPCSDLAAITPGIPADSSLPTNASASVTVTCPYGTTSSVSLVTATVTYDSTKKASHATYVTKD